MSTKVASLSADLSVRTSSFEAGLARARKRVQETQGTLEKFSASSAKGFRSTASGIDTLVGGFTRLKVGIATVIGAAGLTTLVKRQIEAASAINDMSERLQIGTDALQKYQFAAKLVGTSSETLETAVTKLNAKIGDGSYKYKNAEEGLNRIAEAVKNAKDDTQRLNIVNDAFGAKLGSKMLPLLKAGAQGLKDMGDQAERTGNVIDSKTIKATDELGDKLDTLISTMQKSFSQGFLDELVGSSGDLADIYNDPEFAKNVQNIGALFGDLAVTAMKLVSTIGYLIEKYKELSDLSKGSYGMDEKFFDWASKNFDSPKHQHERVIKKMGMGSALGGDMNRMMRMGAGLMQDRVTAPGTPATRKWSPSGSTTSGNTDDQSAKSIKAIFDNLQKETSELRLQNDLYGEKTSVIERARKESEIQNRLTSDGIVLTKGQQAQLQKYLDLLQQQKELQDRNAEYQQTMQDFTGLLRDSFEQAITSGGDLGDIIQGLIKDIAKMALQKQLLDPLFGNGTSGSTGILGQVIGTIGSAIFGSAPSHATGQANVPRDMLAFVHKNEEIVPARQTRGNQRGNGGINVKVVDNAGNKVTAQESSEPDVDLEIILDRANARNINRPGTDTNRALSSLQGRRPVRR